MVAQGLLYIPIAFIPCNNLLIDIIISYNKWFGASKGEAKARTRGSSPVLLAFCHPAFPRTFILVFFPVALFLRPLLLLSQAGLYLCTI